MRLHLYVLLGLLSLTGIAHGEAAAFERVEYFLGEDPGRGNATELPIPEGESTIEAALHFPAGSLPDEPVTQVTIRGVDTEGNWTPPERVTLMRPSFLEDAPDVTFARAEYFLGDDPGLGQGTELPEVAGQAMPGSQIDFPAGSLPDQPVVQLTVRAVDSEDRWSAPARVTVIRPPFLEDGEPVLVAANYGFGGSEVHDELAIPPGATTADADIELPVSLLPVTGFAAGWVQTELSNGVRGPRIPFKVAAPKPERFAGHQIEEVGAWSYSVVDGDVVVATGSLAANGEGISGVDFRALEIEREYTLIVTPLAADSLLPLPNVAVGTSFVSDYSWWQRLHFTDTERGDDEVSSPGADPDGSGVTNLERFLTGTAPGDPPAQFRADVSMPVDPSAGPIISYDRSRLAGALDFLVEGSYDLSEWEPVPVELIEIEALGEEMDRVHIQPVEVDDALSGRSFYRIRVSDD